MPPVAWPDWPRCDGSASGRRRRKRPAIRPGETTPIASRGGPRLSPAGPKSTSGRPSSRWSSRSRIRRSGRRPGTTRCGCSAKSTTPGRARVWSPIRSPAVGRDNRRSHPRAGQARRAERPRPRRVAGAGGGRLALRQSHLRAGAPDRRRELLSVGRRSGVAAAGLEMLRHMTPATRPTPPPGRCRRGVSVRFAVRQNVSRQSGERDAGGPIDALNAGASSRAAPSLARPRHRRASVQFPVGRLSRAAAPGRTEVLPYN